MDKVLAKVLPFLEKYVEWIALGLGALFLTVMVYSYVVQTPVLVKVSGREVTPGQVDEEVKKAPPVQFLAAALKETGILVNPPPVPKVEDEVLSPVVVAVAVPPLPVKWPPDGGWGPEKDPIATVKSFPSLPILTMIGAPAPGRGVYQYARVQGAAPGNVPAPAPAPGPAAVAPAPGVTAGARPGIAAAPNMSSGLPVGAGPAGAIPGIAPGFNPGGMAGGFDATNFERMDIDWVALRWKLNIADLDKAFQAVGLKPDVRLAYSTGFLQVELLRQRKDPVRGTWETETIVPLLPQHRSTTPELPPVTADVNAKLQFLTQVGPNVRTIVQPSFAEWVSGDPAPGMQLDPNGQPVAPPAGIAPPGVVPPAGNFGQPGSGLPAGVGLPPGGFQPGGFNPGGFNPGGFNPQPGAIPQPGGQAMDANGNPIVQPLQPGEIPGEFDPHGQFHPNDLIKAHTEAKLPLPEVEFITYDTTIEAGRVYRYRVRYSIKNPMFQYVFATAGKEALSNTLAVTSKESAWSSEVSTPPRVDFYVRSIGPSSVTFDVVMNENSENVEKLYTFTAGDMIAGLGWNSGWSVVDVRKNPVVKGGGMYLILADAKGRTERREVQKDQATKALKYPPVVDPAMLQPGIGPMVPPPGGPNVPVAPPPFQPPPRRPPGGGAFPPGA